MYLRLAENERIKAYGKHLDETEANERLKTLQNEIDDSRQRLLEVYKLDPKDAGSHHFIRAVDKRLQRISENAKTWKSDSNWIPPLSNEPLNMGNAELTQLVERLVALLSAKIIKGERKTSRTTSNSWPLSTGSACTSRANSPLDWS